MLSKPWGLELHEMERKKKKKLAWQILAPVEKDL